MDKFRKVLKNLFAPAIVLLLVAVMGVLSPAVSVAAALRVNIAAAGPDEAVKYTIENLPTRSVEVGTSIASGNLPSVNNSGYVVLCHAGKEIRTTAMTEGYTYNEVGQYEWRFYNTDGVLFDTYTVNVTDTTYSLSMPSNVVTVAPKDLDKLALPLPSSYVIGGETMEVKTIAASTDDKNYAVVTLENDDEETTEYRLSVKVSMANDTLSAKITDENVTIDLSNRGTGTLKVTYLLSDKNGKLLKALQLSDIEIKNVATSEVTFASIPTAPSVSSLSYYSTVALTAPSADAAKTETTSFSVEAQTSIVKVQAYLYSTEPSSWTSTSNVITLTLNSDGTWTSSNSNYSASDLIEIDGLNVKVKALGYYRFQFRTSTLFGYKMDDDFDNYDAIEQDSNKTYVDYWSDSVRIYRDSVEPNFAWVADYTINEDGTYTATVDGEAVDYDEDFYDYLNTYDNYLPMTDKPDSTTTKKITVNYNQGLVLPAIFPHDNATSFANMKVTAFAIDQIQDANGDSVSDNYAWMGDSLTSTTFTYNMNKHVKINFTETGVGSGTQLANEVTLKATPGLYRVRVVVEEVQPTFLGDNSKYSGGYAQTKTKYLYFYLTSNNEFKCGAAVDNDGNSPVVDESNVLQVSDVYLWEGHTFDFPTPTFSDAHTPTDSIQVDYYLVRDNGTENTVVAKLDYVAGASRVTVDLDDLKGENGEKVTFSYTSLTDTFYIYAVARNFNGMQANLKFAYTPTDSAVTDDKHFSTELFKYAKYGSTSEIAQYGYAWKRAAFKINAVSASDTEATPVTVTVDSSSDFETGKAVHISSITTNWSDVIDGQMSAAVYLVKSDKTLVSVDLKDGNTNSANVVSSWAFNRDNLTVNDLYFTPGVSGEYILVVTAKKHNSGKIYANTTKITIDNNGEISVRPRPTSLSTAASDTETVDKTISLGSTLTLPDYDLTDSEGKLIYASRNRLLYAYDNENLTNIVKGNYTITVMGVTDPNCITGNKFTPSNYGKYKFEYNFYITGEPKPKTVTYVVQVTTNSSSSSILMGEDYDDKKILAGNVTNTTASDNTITISNGDETLTYVVGENSTGTSDKPAYAITLEQFTLANYGAATDFVVDTASLFDYLEPIWDATKTKITGYMYPAIAIPMPNVVSDIASSDEVEITVQKSGSTNYLVSSKKLNAGNSTNSASVLEQIGGYYVFRPEGTFNADCKTAYTKDTYLGAAVKTSNTAGLYTVTYKTSDTSVTYNVTFGDLDNGSIAWNEGFLTYNNGSKDVEITASSDGLVIDKDSDGHRYVTIDMSKVYFTGNSDMEELIAKGPNADGSTDGINPEKLATEYYWSKVSVTVTYEDGTFITSSTWSDNDDEESAIKDHSNYIYKFDLNQGSGTYKVTISMVNSYTSSTVSSSLEFTFDAESTNKNVNLNTVWGIILIVLSVGLLAGVIFYFVKTARATRFVDTPRAPKNKKLKNQDTKAVDAPKDAEAPKKDAE